VIQSEAAFKKKEEPETRPEEIEEDLP